MKHQYTPDELVRITATPLTMGVALGHEFPDGEYVAYPWLRYVEQQVLAAMFRPGNEIIIISIPFQTGKDLAVATDILTANRGWTTMGEIEVGDLVYAPDGSTTRVTQVHPIAWSPNGCYRVATTDGRSVIAGGEHLWRVEPRDAKPRLMTTAELADYKLSAEYEVTTDGKKYHTKHYRLRLPATPLIDSPEVALPLDPYTLGVWLGDGTSESGQLSLNGDDHPHIAALIDGTMTEHRYGTANCVTGAVRLSGGQALRKELAALGLLGNKHIPDVYLSAGTDQRLALFRGLMDTDGYAGGGKAVELTFSDEKLATSAYHLALSLGYRANIAESEARLNGRYISQRWRITFTVMPDDPNPFALPRKANAVKRGLHKQTASIASVERTEDTWTRCITVDREDGMFLAGRHLIPTHNSSYFSLLLPSWYLGRYPNRTWLNISYNDDRAKAWGRSSRNLLRQHGHPFFGVTVDVESDSAGEWHFRDQPGGMISSGIRSTVNGVTANMVSLDDTLKNMEEANSPQVKRRNMDEFDSVIMGRFQSNPNAPTKGLIVNTRLVEDDVGGELLARAAQPGYDGFPVTLINIKAIAEPDPEEAASMTDEELDAWRDCLGRRVGEPLVSRHTPEYYRTRKASMPPGMWMSQYQGIPTYSAASMFPEENWRFWVDPDTHHDKLADDEWLPQLTRQVRVWDLASSEGSGDWTVGTLLGRDQQGRVFVIDRQRFQHAPGEVERLIKATAERDGYGVSIRIERERSGAGITVVDHYKRELLGFDIDGVKAEGDKESRATPYSILQNGQKVHLPRHADWVDGWVREHAQMDGKGKRPKHDDQIDTAAYGVRFLIGGGESMIWDATGLGSGSTENMSTDDILEVELIKMQLGIR